MNNSSNRVISAYSMVGASGCWGTATVLSKATLETLPPVTLLIIQLCASIVFLWSICWLRKIHTPITAQLVKRSLIGILEPGAAYILVLIGLQSISASEATLIAVTEPVMVLVLAGIFLRERITLYLITCSLGALVGAYLTFSHCVGSAGSITGITLVTLGTLCAALYVVLSRSSLQNQPPLFMAALQLTTGFIFVLIIWLLFFRTEMRLSVNQFSIPTALTAAFSGIVQYALAFWLYLIAIRRSEVSYATIYLNLIPVFGIGTAAVFLHEQLTPLQWIGAGIVIIFAGISSANATEVMALIREIHGRLFYSSQYHRRISATESK